MPLPGERGTGIQLTSANGVPATASLAGHWSLVTGDPGRSAVRIRLWVSDPSCFDNKVYASRIEFITRFPSGEALTAWLDRAQAEGWNDILVPVYDMGTAGHPSPTHVVAIRITVYALQGCTVHVDFSGISAVTL